MVRIIVSLLVSITMTILWLIYANEPGNNDTKTKP